MKKIHIATCIIFGLVLTACSSDTAPYGETCAENSFLNTNLTQVSFDIDRSATVNVEASKDLSWRASTSDSWISIDKGVAKGSSSISISVNEDNPKTTPRTGSVNLRSDRYHLSKTITVEQKGTYLNVDKKTEFSPLAGGSYPIVVESNASWSLKGQTDWLTTNVNNGGRGKGGFTVNVKANPTEVERSAILEVYTSNHAVSREIIIQQTPVILVIAAGDTIVKPEGGEYNIVLIALQDWNASCSANWCKVSPNQGNDTQTLNLTVSPNSGTTSRNTTLTVKSGDVSHSILITQPAATLTVDETPIIQGPDAFSKTLSVTSNTNWTATSNATWFKVEQGNGQLTVKASKNETNSKRTAHVTIKALSLTRDIVVTQDKAELSLSPSAISFYPEGGSASLNISSNVSWTASSDASWCTLSPKTGTGDKVISVSASENNTGSKRSARVTIKTDFLEKTIEVTQNHTTLSVSKESISCGTNLSKEIVTITTNTKWVASCNPTSWLSATPNTGTRNTSITIQANAATSESPREGTVTIKAGELSEVIKVTQTGIILNVNPTELSFKVSGETKTATLTTNATVTATSSATWCTASVSGGTISIKTIANTSYSREANVTIKSGDVSRSIKVSQEGVTLNVSSTELPFNASGGTKTVTATSNVAVSATPNATWCTATVSGSTVTINTKPNDSVSERSTTVTIKAGDFSRTVKVTQSGGTNIDIDDYPDDTNLN